MEYAELQCCTNYSFLRGASHAHELLTIAYKKKLSAIAITDYLGVYALPKAYLAWNDLQQEWEKTPQTTPPPKLICGARLPVQEGFTATLLAQSRQGYGLMTQLLTQSFSNKTKAQGSIPWSNLIAALDDPSSQNLFLLLPPLPTYKYYEPLADLYPKQTYITLNRHLTANDPIHFAMAKNISDYFHLPLVATNDVHYHHPDRQYLQDVLSCIRHNTTIYKAGHHLFPNGERYIKSPQQMSILFKDFPQAINNTIAIAQSCQFSLSELRYRYPSEWLPQGFSAQDFLYQLVQKGASWRYPKGVPDSVARQIQHELDLVKQLSFADYFLTIWDIVQFAKKRNILCQGRGSAANSVICYCLGITAIDPVQMDLLFERFISAERNEPPDIDVDFEHERREEVIQYIYQKYGRHRAAMVSAVVTFKGRSILRELSKVFTLPSCGSLEERLKQAEITPHLARRIKNISNEIKGFPRHLSIHSGGFTLSADPITEIVPVEPARMSGRTIIQWDKYDLDILQLLKIDILALGMFSAIKKTLTYLGDRYSLATIPPMDAKTYQMIQKAQTIGTFQIESRAQMSMLGRLQPRCFYDLVVQVAIVRPGPIVGQMVHPYLKRRRGQESSLSPDPRLEKILGKTLGIPLFQEQIMKIAVELAQFSPGEADQLRRAIGAWRSHGDMTQVGHRLACGLIQSGLSKSYVNKMFEYIKGFAEYGFPESHAASFALIAYASAYLKCHHPAEFTCALLNSQPMGFYSPDTLVGEARRQGVQVLPIDPNRSDWDCTIEDDKLRLGWRYIKGFSKELANRIIIERNQQTFISIFDFIRRSQAPINLLERLALGDVFSSFSVNQRQAFWQILAHSLYVAGMNKYPKQQLNLFQQASPIEEEPFISFNSLNLMEAIQCEHQAFGLSCKGHPMGALRKIINLPTTTSSTVKQLAHNHWVETSGLVITRQRPSTAKGVLFATLEDEYGFIDLIIHPNIAEIYKDFIYQYGFLKVTGRLQKDRQSQSVLVKSIKPIQNDYPESKVF